MYITYKGDLIEVPDKCLVPRVVDGKVGLGVKQIHGTKAERQVPNSKRDKWRPESRTPRLQVSKCTRNMRTAVKSLTGRERLDWLMG